MRKVLVVLIVLILALSQAGLAGLQESRWQIIDLLAYPEKVQKGLTQDYAVDKATWVRSDLTDGTPRWLTEVKDRYAYEIQGTPVSRVTLLGHTGYTEAQGAELATRMMLFMRAMGVSAQNSSSAFQALFAATLESPATRFYINKNGIRISMIYFSSTCKFSLTMKKQ